MADWNPSLYLKFGAERTRPAAELVARIAQHPVTFAVDLGCGPGNSTALLHHAWPEATLVASTAHRRCSMTPSGRCRPAGSSPPIFASINPNAPRIFSMRTHRCSG